ncbi:MAG TPA: hypothetical protein VKS80_17140 [Trinickia sp.]|nr:hypothetical protein [Trinickia sp.]
MELNDALFDEFVLPHLTRGRRGPVPRLPLYKIFNYILKMLYLGCQVESLRRSAKIIASAFISGLVHLFALPISCTMPDPIEIGNQLMAFLYRRKKLRAQSRNALY